MKDENLVEAFLEGKNGAFEELMTKYQRPVFYMVKAMVRDTEDARDITQEAFIKAFNNLKNLKKKEQFKFWLFKIAMNRVRDNFRSKKETVEFETWMEPDSRPSPEAKSIRKDLKDKIKEEIHFLPPKQKEVLILRIFQDLDFKEIARILEIKSETARANFHFALKKLRDNFRKRGIHHEM